MSLQLISSAYAQTSSGAMDPFSGTLPFVILMFVIMYFMMIRPQMKKAKEHKEMMAALAKGDEVVTQGGMAGRVTKVGENYVTLDVGSVKDSVVEILVQKQSISNILPKGTLKTL